MDLIDRMQKLASKAETMLGQIVTEEAAKNALVMPFINALGYNVFDPTEVIPEYVADVGIKKGENVDYAIVRDGKLAILIECKPVKSDLSLVHASQLYRYFSVTDARFSVLTNGISYQFYTDLDSPNRMDERPFLEFDLLSFDPQIVQQLKKFTKDTFDVDEILSTASDLKYLRGIKRLLAEEWTNPSEEFVRIFSSRVYSGRLTQSVKDQFADITKKAFQSFVNDRVNQRLKSALERETATIGATAPVDIESSEQNEVDRCGVETTEDELRGFYIVQAIISGQVDPTRIYMRDTQSYCGILLDDNNRKPICRLFFNSAKSMYIGLFDERKNVTRHRIEKLSDIHRYAGELREAVQRHE